MGLPRREVPCERCGWRYEGFHVCFDASKPCPGEGTTKKSAKKKKKVVKTPPDEALTIGDRWGRYHEENRQRDEKIIELYKNEHSLVEIGRMFDISHQTVLKVIRREEEALGEKIVRPRGFNTRFSRKETAGGFN